MNAPPMKRRRRRQMGLADLSVLPRTGFKGTGTVEWLTAQGLKIGADSNIAYRQSGGELAARLAPTEIFLVDDLAATGRLVGQLNGAWAWTAERPRKLIGYPMPRAESHAWFAVTGEKSPAMFAKICGVDLRPQHFAVGRIAQTSLAKMSGIIIRADLGRTPGLLCSRRQRLRRISLGLPDGRDGGVLRRARRALGPEAIGGRRVKKGTAKRKDGALRRAPAAPAERARAKAPPEFQDPHKLRSPANGQLETAIGREVREFRKKLDMTVAAARRAGEALRRHAVEDRERHDLAVAGHAAGAVEGAPRAGHRLLPPL